ncbi:MAG: helix-turn-helix domain-containing protein [Ardenticatenaceae bacterium]
MNDLGQEINELLGSRSQLWLAEQAGIRQASVSRIIHGKQRPTPSTLEAIAQVLGVDPLHLMRLAGVPLPPATNDRDPSVEYIAQRLDKFPEATRKKAIHAVSSVLDAIYDMTQQTAIYEQIQLTHPEVVAEAKEQMKQN